MIAALIKRLTGTLLLAVAGLTVTVPWLNPAAQTLPGILPGSGSGGGLFSRSGFLPVDEAFSFYTSLPTAGVVTLHWNIAAEYYLYRDKFAISLTYPQENAPGDNALHTIALELPAGIAHNDEYFGDVEVFYNTLEFQVPIPEAARDSTFTMTIHYQGCAELGLCYPPQRRDIAIQL